MEHGTICLYADKGVGLQAFQCMKECLSRLAGDIYSLQILSAAEVIDGEWRHDARLFVMPGGADEPYARKLAGTGNVRIREFVKNGGSYLGVCAGAYYGCARIVFDEGSASEIVEERELRFFDGTAVGPVFPPYDATSNRGCRAVRIENAENGFDVYFNGGCTFVPRREGKDFTVMAAYGGAERAPAVISVACGAGRVVLSGVHFEYAPERMNADDVWQAPLRSVLQKSEAARVAFINDVAEELRLERNFK